MLKIEASHINFGGGYSLLIELLKFLGKNSIPNLVYISHKEVFNELGKSKYEHTTFVKTSSLGTL